MGLTVMPSMFTLAPGASRVLTITANVSKLGVGQWVTGEIKLKAGGKVAPAAHMPFEVFVGRATAVTIDSPTTSGSKTVQLTSKVAIQQFGSRVWGLAKGSVTHL